MHQYVGFFTESPCGREPSSSSGCEEEHFSSVVSLPCSAMHYRKKRKPYTKHQITELETVRYFHDSEALHVDHISREWLDILLSVYSV